MKVH
jgi:hypothetical protein